MASTPLHLYVISSDHLGIIFIGSSKQKVYDFLAEHEKLNMIDPCTYNEFTRRLKKHGRSKFYTQTGVLNADYMPVNTSMVSPGSLFS